MKYTIKNKNFLDWRFTDRNDFVKLGEIVFEKLLLNGRCTLTSQELLDMTGYIPVHYIPVHIINEDEIDEDIEIDPSDCQLVGIETAEDVHDKLRNILIENGNQEYGDCIIDEICELFNFSPTEES